MLDKIWKFLIYFVVIFTIVFVVNVVVWSISNSIKQAIAAPLPKTEFTTHRKVDNEMGVVCYTTVMLKYGEISELSISCVPLSSVCDYSERKVSKISETVQDWANSQD